MTAGIVQSLGGLGLFLLGMAIMSGALRSLASEQLRHTLARTVSSPWKGVLTGTVATALLQSSSATTVAAVAFVGAGLLSFSESLGIIFGANIGTTVTGWLVALIGFKLNLGQTLLPLVLVGALLRLTGRSRWEQIGMSVAGFGLVFVGIGTLQDGLGGMQGVVTPDQFPGDTFVGRLQLVLIGLIITLITQSSRRGGRHRAGCRECECNFTDSGRGGRDRHGPGHDGDRGDRDDWRQRRGKTNRIRARDLQLDDGVHRTAAVIALHGVDRDHLPRVTWQQSREFLLVGFHTFFNAVGVLLVLPVTSRFATLITRMFPERGNPLTRRLDRSLLVDPAFALRAVNESLRDITTTLLRDLHRRLVDPRAASDPATLADRAEAMDQAGEYLQELVARTPSMSLQDYVVSMHVLDHLRRMDKRMGSEAHFRRCRDDKAALRHGRSAIAKCAGARPPDRADLAGAHTAGARHQPGYEVGHA